MELFKHKLHVFLAGFFMITLTMAGNMTQQTEKFEGNTTVKDKTSTSPTLELKSTIKSSSTIGTTIGGKKTTPRTPQLSTVGDYGGDDEDATNDGHISIDNGDDDDGLLFAPKEEHPENDPYATPTIPFKKCCAKDESFNAGLKCVKREGKLRAVGISKENELGQKYPWFPTYILTGSESLDPSHTNILDVNRVDVQYGSMVECPESERLVLQWHQEDEAMFTIFASNGTIVELHSALYQTMAMWPVDAYCLESVPSKEYSYHVAFLCPCIHKVCIRKCCPRGFYYNETYNACNEYKNLSVDYSPTFYHGRVPFKSIVTHYVLRRMPVCRGLKIESLFSPKESLYVEKNGSLLLQEENGKWHFLNNSRYCADYFVNEIVPERRTNVLYCLHAKKMPVEFRRKKFHYYPRESKGDFFTLNFFLFFGTLGLVVIYE